MTDVLEELWNVIDERAENPRPDSYVSRLISDPKGIDKVCEKVGEEAIEFILAIKTGVPERSIEEGADLLFHFLVALRAADLTMADVLEELKKRRK